MTQPHINGDTSRFYPRRGIHGELVDLIGREIVSGRFEAGTVLDMAALQVDRDVSQTALREALRVLAGKGLVEARQKRGTIVRSRSGWNLLDPDILRWQVASNVGLDMFEALAEVRAIIEPASARLAAVRRSDDDIAALEIALTRMVETVEDPGAHAEADVDFHRALAVASGNELLARIGGVFEALLRARDEFVHREVRHEFEAPHAAVLDAVRTGDPERAEHAMRDLLSIARRDALELAPELPREEKAAT